MSFRSNWIGRLALAALLGGTGFARAEVAYKKIDTEYLFGFITGTDVGEA